MYILTTCIYICTFVHSCIQVSMNIHIHVHNSAHIFIMHSAYIQLSHTLIQSIHRYIPHVYTHVIIDPCFMYTCSHIFKYLTKHPLTDSGKIYIAHVCIHTTHMYILNIHTHNHTEVQHTYSHTFIYLYTHVHMFFAPNPCMQFTHIHTKYIQHMSRTVHIRMHIYPGNIHLHTHAH